MRKILAVALAVGFIASPAMASEQSDPQTTSRESSKGKIIGTVVGAAGGFALGIFAGLNWFDDAIDSDRKVWTTAIAFGAAGGVGGYFVGRAASRGGARHTIQKQTGAQLLPPTFSLARPRSSAASPMPSRAANMRVAAALSEPVQGIIAAWRTPAENSLPPLLPRPRQ